MAKLPTAADVRRVSPISLPRIGFNEAAFTAGPRAMQQAGSDIFKLGVAIAEEESDNEAKKADAELGSAIRRLRFGDPDSADASGYESYEGQTALDQREAVRQSIQDAYDSIHGRLSKNAARKFSSLGMSRVNRATEAYEIKTFQARQTAFENASTLRRESLREDFVADPFNVSLDELERETREYANRKFFGDKTAIKETVEAETSAAIDGAVRAIAVNDPAAAHSFYKANKKKVDPKTRTALENFLKEGVEAQRAMEEADRIWAMGGGFGTMLDRARLINKHSTRDLVLARLTRRMREQKMLRSMAASSAASEAHKFINAGGTYADLWTKMPKVMAQLATNPAQLEQLQRQEVRVYNQKTFASELDGQRRAVELAELHKKATPAERISSTFADVQPSELTPEGYKQHRIRFAADVAKYNSITEQTEADVNKVLKYYAKNLATPKQQKGINNKGSEAQRDQGAQIRDQALVLVTTRKSKGEELTDQAIRDIAKEIHDEVNKQVTVDMPNTGYFGLVGKPGERERSVIVSQLTKEQRDYIEPEPLTEEEGKFISQIVIDYWKKYKWGPAPSNIDEQLATQLHLAHRGKDGEWARDVMLKLRKQQQEEAATDVEQESQRRNPVSMVQPWRAAAMKNSEGSRSLTEDEIMRNPRFKKAVDDQRASKSALTGELGVFLNPDGSHSTERSTTVQIDGKWVNIPMLVKGQDENAIRRILAGTPNKKDYETAVRRAKERMKLGQELPTYATLKDAESAARARSDSK